MAQTFPVWMTFPGNPPVLVLDLGGYNAIIGMGGTVPATPPAVTSVGPPVIYTSVNSTQPDPTDLNLDVPS